VIKDKIRALKHIAGPGILFAATAIGVSHLVQSTSAGAQFGFSLLLFVILANLLKYPFFEFGSRYTAATGKSLIEGYYQLHQVWLYTYLLVTILSMFFVTAAVGAVTIGFMEQLIGLNALTGFSKFTHFTLFGIGLIILLIGQFNVLEKLIKVLALTLLLTTVVAFIVALKMGPMEGANLFPPLETAAVSFLLPLMGWMPTAVDLSTWNSLWTKEKIKQNNFNPGVKRVVQEFNIGYLISALLAICFLTMGVMLVYGRDKEVPSQAVAFSQFVIDLYTTSIGQWATYVISIAAFAIMFSTFITILDGYGRAISEAIRLLRKERKKHWYNAVVLTVGVIGLTLILLFENSPSGFNLLINTATTLSFIIAPVIAILNYRLVFSNELQDDDQPKLLMKWLSWLGIIFLIGFSIWFFMA
jgi:Mn2+/Fe2+ NRAMP family transporter